VLAAFLLATTPAAGNEPPAILYAYPDQSVWTTKLDKQGLPANPLLRVAEILFSRAGLTWQAHPYPATRMFETLRSGTANFSMLVKSPALDQCCLVGHKPVAKTELRVYHTAATPPVSSRTDLRGKNVIVIRGYSYGGLLAQLSAPGSGVTLEHAVSHQAAFTMLEHGRADYLLDYSGPAREILEGRPGINLQHETLDRLEVYLVLWRGFPDAEATMARLEAIADQLDLTAQLGSMGE
jgi:ABC-type amino acid transport substrate-binding protein